MNIHRVSLFFLFYTCDVLLAAAADAQLSLSLSLCGVYSFRLVFMVLIPIDSD
jgi:hypothetical protein